MPHPSPLKKTASSCALSSFSVPSCARPFVPDSSISSSIAAHIGNAVAEPHDYGTIAQVSTPRTARSTSDGISSSWSEMSQTPLELAFSSTASTTATA